MRTVAAFVIFAFALTAPQVATAQSRIVEGAVETNSVPGPVEYAVLLPDGYDPDGDPLPLLLNLHGRGGDSEFLRRRQPIFDELWADGSLPPVVVATPSAARSMYMNYRNGAERWADFIRDDFLPHLQATYRVRADPQGTMLTGVGGELLISLAIR